MRRGSIRLRLLAAAVASVTVALAVAGAGLMFLFEGHVERRVVAELETHLRQLVAGIDAAPDGAVTARGPTEPRFAVPFSGLYWQVDPQPAGDALRSRSLWDTQLAFPPVAMDGRVRTATIAGPRGTQLLAIERDIRIGAGTAERSFRVIVAIDRAEVTAASRAFAGNLVPSLAVLAAVLVAASWVQIAVGLRPLERLRGAVADVAAGRKARLDPEAPSEVRPVVDEVNRLLDRQDDALAAARHRAADLAHGLKTPLQALAADIRALEARGETAIAADIAGVADAIRRHVDRELARARIGGPRSGATTLVRPAAESVMAVIRRMPRGDALSTEIEVVPGDLAVAVDQADLAEILGNLAENACRFAATRIAIAARTGPGGTVIEVNDDGPGIPAAEREGALARGNRLDTAAGGHGLGLAIVADTVAAYGGELSLEDAGPGLRAVVRLPAAQQTPTAPLAIRRSASAGV